MCLKLLVYTTLSFFLFSSFEFSSLDKTIAFADRDRDGIYDHKDNCPDTYNPSQDDSDGDGLGDVCDDDDCGCLTERQLIYVCQDGMTRRVNCSALSDPNTFCGPCGTQKEEETPPCNECTPDEDGNITICRITNTRLLTFIGKCEDFENYFDDEGNLKSSKDKCGPCSCELIGDIDSDGDGVCDSLDECPDNPLKSEAGMCGCDAYDSDGDWVCDEDDICPGGSDKIDKDEDGVPDFCDLCPDHDDRIDSDGDGIPDGCDSCPFSPTGDSDNDGICDDEDKCPGGDDNIDNDMNGIPDACEIEKCLVSGNSEFEYLQDVKINNWFNLTNDNGGYAQFSDPSLMFFHGDSLKLWMTPGYLENIAELSLAIYVDWNGDKDFNDAQEQVFHKRALRESGADIVIPAFAKPGEICIRFIVDYGRIVDPCDPCIDGEVEDYTIIIKEESCDQTEENFDYNPDSPLQGLDGGWGWIGPWRANISGSPKARILQGSLIASNSDTEGHKLGILTQSGTNYMMLRELSLSSQETWLSFHTYRRGGLGKMELQLGATEQFVSIDEEHVVSIGGQAGPKLPEEVASYIVLKINSGDEGSIDAWVNPSASQPLNSSPDISLEGLDLSASIDQLLFSFYGMDNVLSTDHYLDEIRMGCEESTVHFQEQGGGMIPVVDASITISPNPIGQGTNAGITLSNATYFQGTLNLYDMTGSLIFTQPAVAGLNVLATQSLQPGMYVVEIVTPSGTITEQLIIQS